jgi:hypothetical protein
MSKSVSGKNEADIVYLAAFRKAAREQAIKDMPTINSLLPRAMAMYALFEGRYNFRQEEAIWEAKTQHLGVKRTFRDYFISMYSGQDPCGDKILFARSYRGEFPLNEDGTFRSSKHRDSVSEAARKTDFLKRTVSQALNV